MASPRTAEQALVDRARAGDEVAFAELYRAFSGRVYAYLLTVLRNPHDAEDVMQEVFARMYGSLHRYEPDRGELSAWLFATVRNEALRRRGERAAIPLPPDAVIDLAGPSGTDPRGVTDHDFLALVGSLPAMQRDAIVLRYLLGLTNEEVAKLLNRSRDAVRQMQSRGLRSLASRFGQGGSAHTARQHHAMRRRRRSARVLESRRRALIAPPR